MCVCCRYKVSRKLYFQDNDYRCTRVYFVMGRSMKPQFCVRLNCRNTGSTGAPNQWHLTTRLVECCDRTSKLWRKFRTFVNYKESLHLLSKSYNTANAPRWHILLQNGFQRQFIDPLPQTSGSSEGIKFDVHPSSHQKATFHAQYSKTLPHTHLHPRRDCQTFSTFSHSFFNQDQALFMSSARSYTTYSNRDFYHDDNSSNSKPSVDHDSAAISSALNDGDEKYHVSADDIER